MGTPLTNIQVHTQSRNYEILIGSGILGDSKIARLAGNADRTALVVSATVSRLHGDYIRSSLAAVPGVDYFTMKDGEENKSYRYAEEFFNLLLEKGYSRKSMVVGIGGGVVGDFAGFIAAGYMRGIELVHVPTTLLAMVDSSIGGKVAVNISAGKNIVGAFYQPALIISDASFLDTLPGNEMINGFAENVKHALIGQSDLLDLLLSHSREDFIKDRDLILKMITLSAGFKVDVVGRDERESGLRAILNFGHTVGHAIESQMGLKGISHGEAVSLGMKAEMEISRRLGLLASDDLDIFRILAEKYGLIGSEISLDVPGILHHIKFDKKNYAGSIRFALLKGIGQPIFDQEVDLPLIGEVISAM